ncbi:MAG: hypothetical protein HY343_02805 [Lentisphaerae bacterium]|nr:hypothetical protein [Lentisphaerota bacterium]
MINKEPVSGHLRIRLFNDSDQEIGRATTPVSFPSDDARYVPFLLDKEIPVLMTKFVELDLKPE